MLAAVSGPVARAPSPPPASPRSCRPRRRPPPFRHRRRRTGAGGATPFGAEIDAAAARYGIDPALLKGLIRQESGFDPSARSGAGAMGLTQLMPGTAAVARRRPDRSRRRPSTAAPRYLKQQLDRFGGDPAKALAAYNAGPGAVAKYGGVPPYAETQNYVQKRPRPSPTSTAAAPRPPRRVPATTTPVLATGRPPARPSTTPPSDASDPHHPAGRAAGQLIARAAHRPEQAAATSPPCSTRPRPGPHLRKATDPPREHPDAGPPPRA